MIPTNTLFKNYSYMKHNSYFETKYQKSPVEQISHTNIFLRYFVASAKADTTPRIVEDSIKNE